MVFLGFTDGFIVGVVFLFHIVMIFLGVVHLEEL